MDRPLNLLLNLLLVFLATVLVTPLAVLVLLLFAVFAGSTTLLAAILIAFRLGYVYTNVGLQFVASYLSTGQRYPRLGPVDVQTDTDTDTTENQMTPPSSPSNSDPDTVTPPPRGPLPNYMTGIDYVRPGRRQSTSAAHSPRRELSPPASASPSRPPSTQRQPDQPPRSPTCSCITPHSGLPSPVLYSPATSPTPSSSPSPSSSSSNNNIDINTNNNNINSTNNNTWTTPTNAPTTTAITTSNGPQPSYDSYTDLYRRHCERCFEKRTLWFHLQRSRARVSNESLRAIIEAAEEVEEGEEEEEEDAPALVLPEAVVPPRGRGIGGGKEVGGVSAGVDGLPRVVIPRAIPERAGVEMEAAVEAQEESVGGDAGGEEGSEMESAISELDLVTPGSSSPLLSTVLSFLVPTPLGSLVDKRNDKGKGKNH